jgi:ferredoxin
MMRAADRSIPVGCRGGGCGVCRVRVVSGDYTTMRMSRAHVTEADEEAGIALACRLLPSSDIVVVPAPAGAGDG